MSDKQGILSSRRKFIKFSALGLSAGVGSAKAAWQSPAPKTLPNEDRETVIIGSGFGGAISAYRLTAAGHPVTLLEKGRRWDGELDGKRFSPNLYPDGRSTWLRNRTVMPVGPELPIPVNTGVLQGRDMAGKRILSGAAYGGGSIVYGGVLKKPNPEVFTKVFPEELSFDELQPYYDEVAVRLKRSLLPKDLEKEDYWKHVRLAREHTEAAGLKSEDMHSATDWEIVRKELSGEVEPSIIHGEAVYGVNSGAKASLDQSYLKDAEATGLMEVRTLHRVLDIFALDDGRYEILFEQMDTRGNIKARGRITCQKLILAAGCMGSNALLVKAKAKSTLPKLNEHVGQGWGNNGNVYGLRLGVGATGRWQGGPPSIGIADYDNPRGPLFVEHPQLPVGLDIFGLMYFGIGINPTRGHFYYDEKSDKVKLSYPRKDPGQENINQALIELLDKLNEANGGFTSSILDNFKSKVKDSAVYHPLGGMCLGKATDMYGRVKGYPGLYVNDGSLLPGSSACTNPSFTISAIAERNIDKILDEDFPVL